MLKYRERREFTVEEMVQDITESLTEYFRDELHMTPDQINDSITDFDLAENIRYNPKFFAHLTIEQIGDRVLRIY